MLANIGSVERNNLKLSGESAGNAITVKLTQFTGRQICADDGRLLQIQARIDNVIETRKRKLIDHLGAKIIDDEKITLGVGRGIIGGGSCHTVAKATTFKILDHSNGTVIKNVIAALGHYTRDGGGKMRFAKSRAAKE